MNENIILAVDADQANLLVIDKTVELYCKNCKLVKARSAEECLTIVENTRIDLVLIDSILPEISGFEICRRLKSNPLTESITVILIATGDISHKLTLAGIEAGAEDVYFRPIDSMELAARINVILRIKRNDQKRILKPLDHQLIIRPLHINRIAPFVKLHDECKKIINHADDELQVLNGISEKIVTIGKYFGCRVILVQDGKTMPGSSTFIGDAAWDKRPFPVSDTIAVNFISNENQPGLSVLCLSCNDTNNTTDYDKTECLLISTTISNDLKLILIVIANKSNFFDDKEIVSFKEIVVDMGVKIQSGRTEMLHLAASVQLSQKNNAIIHTLLNATTDYAGLIDIEGKLLSLNDSLAKVIGLSINEILGQKLIDLPSSVFTKLRLQKIQEAIQVEKPVFFNDRRGDEVFEHRLFPMLSPDQKVENISFFSRKVTPLQRLEDKQKLLVIAVEQSPESIVITDHKAMIQYVNPAFEKITGYSQEEAIGENPKILKSGKHTKAFYASLWSCLAEGTIWRGRLINKKKDGSLFDEDASIAPVKNKAGKIVNYVAVKRDVTAQVKLENKLLQRHKLEAVGTLAAGIAHDFNNILFSILGYTELALDASEKNSRQYNNLKEIIIATRRASNLVNQVAMFSRQDGGKEKYPVMMKLVIKESLQLISSTFLSAINITSHITSNNRVKGLPSEIQQIIINLCTNAGQAMKKKGGGLEVLLEDVVVGDKGQDSKISLPKGLYVKLSVIDTGQGIPKKDLPKIFDPFFTTRPPGEGSGLGLSVVHGIVKSYNGDISVESSESKGTSVEIYLPAMDDLEPIVDQDEKLFISKGDETVLLVDDEEAIVKMEKQILESLGYTVIAFNNPIDALEYFRKEPDKFDIIISDMTMPVMTGDCLAKKITEIKPDIPFVLCTGYIGTEDIKNNLMQSVSTVLMKPLRKKEIAETISLLLDKSVKTNQ